MNCKVCGSESGKYQLCKKCYYLSKDGKLSKCEKCGKWHQADVPCGEVDNSEPVDNSSEFVYNAKESLLTECEKKFYSAIISVLPDGLQVFPQINLAAAIEKFSDSHFQNELFRNIDFLITDSELKPLIFIEINDSSHNSPQRRERDQKVKNICEEAGIPIITLWTSYGVNRDYIRRRIEETLSSLPVKRIAHSKESAKKSSEGCYVATCVYGSYDCPEVWTLRRFRDYRLAKSVFGRLFIRTYYAVSPKVVKLFGSKMWFRHFWKIILDKIISRLRSRGYEDTPYYDR